MKRNIEVIVITGDDKGKRGKVLHVLDKGRELLVEGVNLVKKHVKANPNRQEEGGIILKTLPILSSKVQAYDATNQKGSKIGVRRVENKQERYLKSNQKTLV